MNDYVSFATLNQESLKKHQTTFLQQSQELHLRHNDGAFSLKLDFDGVQVVRFDATVFGITGSGSLSADGTWGRIPAVISGSQL